MLVSTVAGGERVEQVEPAGTVTRTLGRRRETALNLVPVARVYIPPHYITAVAVLRGVQGGHGPPFKILDPRGPPI